MSGSDEERARRASVYWRDALINEEKPDVLHDNDDPSQTKAVGLLAEDYTPDPSRGLMPTPTRAHVTAPAEFERQVIARQTDCRAVLLAKNDEYSRDGDRLHNFRRAGEKRGVDPMTALQGMAVKHEVSIDDIVRDCLEGRPPTSKRLAEKFNDAHNYLHLLEALIRERM